MRLGGLCAVRPRSVNTAPANVVKFYLGHSSMSTTNKYYSIVDESHMEMTQKVMDKMLQGANTQDDLDIGAKKRQKNRKKKRSL